MHNFSIEACFSPGASPEAVVARDSKVTSAILAKAAETQRAIVWPTVQRLEYVSGPDVEWCHDLVTGLMVDL